MGGENLSRVWVKDRSGECLPGSRQLCWKLCRILAALLQIRKFHYFPQITISWGPSNQTLEPIMGISHSDLVLAVVLFLSI